MNPKVWMFSIGILLLFLALSVYYIVQLRGDITKNAEERDRLEMEILIRDAEIKIEEGRVERYRDSLEASIRRYDELAIKDSLNNIMYKRNISSLRRELKKLSSIEVSDLMIETYEKSNSINLSDSL